MSGNIVTEWLKSLHLGQYAESFIDNGYDDLEICKQVGDPDLDAIGVFNPVHRGRLLQSVRTLREEGAASVYFTLEESAAVHEECFCDSASARSSRTSSGRSEKDVSTNRITASPGAASSVESGQEIAKYLDEYEEGKAELVKIPRMQLKALLRDKLGQDGVRLSCHPYTTKDGERGDLEGLASNYAHLFSTHYVDVLAHLEELRRAEWNETSTERKERPSTTPEAFQGAITVVSSVGMTTSQSQPIYVPGKYSPSSCLSDKEEDEIYGFGYGVFAAQIARQQQQRLIGQTATSHQPLLMQQHHNYQTCLSPRSAYFYEFPPNDQNYCTNTNKKRTTFSRFLRGLKTSHRKEKHAGVGAGASSPRHGRAAVARGVPQRVDTPDSVLQSGLALTDLGQHAVLRSMVDPRDYDRLRHLQMNGGTPNTFEETIYRLKVQEALKKREKFTKEHEEILRDIKQGLSQLGKEGIRGPLTVDDTYMYDDDARMLAPSQAHHQGSAYPSHWYDEPPYESDPEDFLMGGQGDGPTATIQNGRVCFTLNLNRESRGEGVISLRSAGDISLPKGGEVGELGGSAPRATPRRGLILPSQAGYPPAIIPLRSSRDRESGDYAGSDVQSIGSRLSTLSVGSEQQDMGQTISPQYYSHLEGKIRHYRKTSGFSRSEDGLSPSQSSDYEDQEDFSNCSQQIATVHVSSDGRSAGVSGLVGKVRGLREDVQRKISRLKGETIDHRSVEATFQCSASSVESLPSGSGSSTQALVRAGSNHSSISTEEPDASPTDQIVGRARALVDNTPSPYDKEALKFKAGDIIDIVSMNASGLWKGICRGKKGSFKFINVELLSERTVKSKRGIKWHQNIKGKPASLEDLLQKIDLQEYISVFILNGYEDLELFKEIEPSDLDYLGIVNTDHRNKILTAVQLLHDLDSGSEGEIAGSSSECEEHRSLNREATDSPFSRRQFPRDSGCYDASLKSNRPNQLTSPQGGSDTSDSAGFSDNKNNLDSIVEQCNNEILARVRQAQKNSLNLREELSYHPNIPNSASIELQKKAKDSYVSVHGQTTLIDPCRKNNLNKTAARKNLEDLCEADQKLTSVKYVVGGSGNHDLESSNLNIVGRSCLSEKSSDSGVSSSSLSSANTKETHRPVLAHNVVENPTHTSFKKTMNPMT